MEEILLENFIETPQLNLEIIEQEMRLLNNINISMYQSIQQDFKNILLFLVVIISIIVGSLFLKLVYNND